MTLKSENALLLTTRNQVVLQGTNKSFQDVHLNAKVYWISTASLWNSATVLILTCSVDLVFQMEAVEIQQTFASKWTTWKDLFVSCKTTSYDESSKVGHFQISKSIFGADCDLIFLKPKFLFEYQIRRTTFISNIFHFNHFLKNFVKVCPIFAGSPLFLFTKYQHFLWVCCFLCKDLTNFGYLC